MQEPVFFSDSAVRVTSTEATFGQMRLPVASIKSVRVATVPPSRNYLFYSGVVAIALAVLLSTTMRWFPANGDFGPSYILLDITRAVLWFAGPFTLLVWYQATRYLVKVTGEFGEKYVVVARRMRYARQVANAINAAIKAQTEMPARASGNATG